MVKGFIDTHAHLYAEEFDADREEMLQRAKEAGIGMVLLPNIDGSTIEGIRQLTKVHPEFCKAMMGLHPCNVTPDYKVQLEAIKKELDEGQYIAVGEIGIDLYWDKSTQEIQEAAFITQCEWAYEKGLPIAIHSRESTGLLIEILQKMKNRPGGVFHCFGGSLEEAKQIMEMGMYLGIGGVVTFKNSTLKNILPTIGLSRIILETDAPYLAPVPHRGKRNESSYMALIAHFLSEVYQLPIEEIEKQTTDNAIQLFRLE